MLKNGRFPKAKENKRERQQLLLGFARKWERG